MKKDDTTTVGRYRPLHPLAGRMAERLSLPLLEALGNALAFYSMRSRHAIQKGRELQGRLARGESLYLIGLCPAGHNSAAALVEVSRKEGIRPICINEEERYTGINDDGSFPIHALKEVLGHLEERDKRPSDVFAILASWDYLKGLATSSADRL